MLFRSVQHERTLTFRKLISQFLTHYLGDYSWTIFFSSFSPCIFIFVNIIFQIENRSRWNSLSICASYPIQQRQICFPLLFSPTKKVQHCRRLSLSCYHYLASSSTKTWTDFLLNRLQLLLNWIENFRWKPATRESKRDGGDIVRWWWLSSSREKWDGSLIFARVVSFSFFYLHCALCYPTKSVAGLAR